MATATFASSRAGVIQIDSRHQQPVEETYLSTFFCRALFDYQSTDASSLSFYRGDIIEVLTQLDSGWWDGLLGEDRGWFPSNYVQKMTFEEAEAELAQMEHSTGSEAYDSGVDVGQSYGRRGEYDQDNDWARQQTELHHVGTGRNGHTALSASEPAAPNDYWVPSVTETGQIFYVNTHTGEQSRDLPLEVDEGVDLQDYPGMSSSADPHASHSGGGRAGAVSNELNGNHAGFGVSHRSGTPEPWVKRLADDGMSYYYLNTLDGQVQWTRPGPYTQPPPESTSIRIDRRPTDASQTSMSDHTSTVTSRDNPFQSGSSRLRSDSTSSYTQGASSSSKRFSVYSDDSDIQPRDLDDPPLRRTVSSDKRQRQQLPPNGVEHGQLEHSQGEQAGLLLRQALTQAEPETLEELADRVRGALVNVAHAVDENNIANNSARATEVDDLVAMVVVAVRNLLSSSGALSGGSHDERSAADATATAAMQQLQSQLKTSQRKVTATLSKLVLSARAARFKRESLSVNMMVRVEQDVADLQLTVDGFVAEAQRAYALPVVKQYHERFGRKRLRGVFGIMNVGPGIPGGGTAASWKGFGYVALQDNVHPPGRILDEGAIADVQARGNAVDERLVNFGNYVTSRREDSLIGVSDALAHVSSFILLVQDINVAHHVDVDGIRRDQQDVAPNDPYLQAVNYARTLLRSFETAMQSVYDNAASLLTLSQSMKPNDTLDSAQRLWESTTATVSSLRNGLKNVQELLGKLLVLGHEQADTAQIDYRGSIEWRMSQISVINGKRPLSDLLGALQNGDIIGDNDEPLDLGDALTRRGPRPGVDPLEEMPRANGLPPPHFPQQPPRADPHDYSQQNGSSLPGGFTRSPSPPLSLILDDDILVPEKSKSPPRAAKIKQILGDDAPQRYIDKANADAKPWYLRLEYDANEVLENPDGGIRGGTLPALVERLTTHEYGDPIFIKTFLMTFKSFTTLNELFDLLVQRYRVPPPKNLTPKELEDWTKQKQHFVRLRVLNTFKTMVTDDDVLEKDDVHIFDRMKEFVSSPEVSQASAAKHLLVLIDRVRNGAEFIVKMTPAVGTTPASIVPKVSSSRRVKLLDIDPLEMARQLTILESRLYNKVRTIECLQRAREQRGDNPDHIADIIQVANKIAYWVAHSVLSKEDSRKRATILKQFIAIADRCRSLHNFSSMVAIISGLNMPPIRRLKRSWEQVNNRVMSQLGTCEMTLDSAKNFANYRATIAKVSPPCVPFFGFYLTNLTFIQDGSKDMLPGNLINFGKRQKAAEVIREIKHWQSKPYNLNPLPNVQAFIEESLNEFSDSQDWSDIFWNQSLEREPREREDERMARLLQESGFL